MLKLLGEGLSHSATDYLLIQMKTGIFTLEKSDKYHLNSRDKVNITNIGTNWQHAPPNVMNWQRKYIHVRSAKPEDNHEENQIWDAFYISGLCSSKVALSQKAEKLFQTGRANRHDS